MQYYETLGIETDATDEEIKKAYRRKAQENHPDKGGDSEVFLAVQKAYEVLSDSEKRKHYDKYGEELNQTTDPAQAQVIALFTQVMSEYLDNYTDVVSRMKDIVDGRLQSAYDHIANLVKEKGKNDIVRRKLWAKKGNGLLLQVLRKRRKDVWDAYRGTQQAVRELRQVREMVEEYAYVPDARPVSSSWTTSWGGFQR